MRMTSTKLVFSVTLFGFVTLLVEGRYLLSNQQCTVKSPHLYLNGSKHGIMQVNAIELEQLLSSSKVPVMVEFYATWCGDCQNFEPHFYPFGHRVKDWRVIKIAVLSCFDVGNRQTCSKQGASRFPTLKIFPAKSKHGTDGEALIIGDKNIFRDELGNEQYELHKFVNVMIDRVVKFQKENHSDWWEVDTPDLTLHKNIEAIKDLAILETNEAIDIDQMFTPSAVILDLDAATSGRTRELRKDPQKLKIVRMCYHEFREQTRMNVTPGSLVSLERKARTITYKVLGAPENEKELTNLLVDYYNAKNPDFKVYYPLYFPFVPPIEVNETSTKDPAKIKRRRYTVYSSDLESALLMALYSDVGAMIDISGPHLQNLLNLLHVLELHYPKILTQTRKNIASLYHWVQTVQHTPQKRLTGKEFALEVENIWGKPCQKYIGCKGSKPTYGYYPCGIWTMWHVLTVQYYLKDQNTSRPPNHNMKVLNAMVGYMGSFFGCRACADHFLNQTQNGTLVVKEVQTAADNVLFLWEQHNSVNVRLREKSKTNDPVYPKMVFPNVEHCKQCYNHPERVPRNDSYEAQLQILRANDFNRKEVLKFLVEHFSNVELKEGDQVQWKDPSETFDGKDTINLSMEFVPSSIY